VVSDSNAGRKGWSWGGVVKIRLLSVTFVCVTAALGALWELKSKNLLGVGNFLVCDRKCFLGVEWKKAKR